MVLSDRFQNFIRRFCLDQRLGIFIVEIGVILDYGFQYFDACHVVSDLREWEQIGVQ